MSRAAHAGRPLTPRMLAVLRYLAAQERQQTPAQIAYGIGISEGPPRLGRQSAGRGGWTGHMSPAQHVIGTLTALRKRGLVGLMARSDGLSGTAYHTTEAGDELARRS